MGRPRKIQINDLETDSVEATQPRPSVSEPRSGRSKRIPINGYRNILEVTGQEPGFHYCWVNEDNVPRFENGWYDFVSHDVVVGDRKVNAASCVGGRISLAVGNGVTAYLMRVPQEYYDEDMEAYHAEIDDREASMKSNLNSKDDGRYGKVEVAVNNRISVRR